MSRRHPIHSLLTAPFPVQPRTTVKAAIDVYARNPESARRHLTAHLRSAASEEEELCSTFHQLDINSTNSTSAFFFDGCACTATGRGFRLLRDALARDHPGCQVLLQLTADPKAAAEVRYFRHYENKILIGVVLQKLMRIIGKFSPAASSATTSRRAR